MGFLSSFDLIECSASDLVGQYVGHTGPKTIKLFEKALGKVLFVDEAYRLSPGHFAKEAIDEIVGLMTKEKFMNKMVIIFAGYEKEMNTLLSANPGLSSRFSEEIILTNMSAARCLQILDKELRESKIFLSELGDRSSSSHSEMESIIERMSRLSNWGNARDVKTIAQKLIHRAFDGVASTPGTAPSLSVGEVIVIMKDLLNQQRQRLNIPQISSLSPSSTPPMASSSNPAPLPPQSGSSSVTNGSQPSKPPAQRGSDQSSPKPPSQSGPPSTFARPPTPYRPPWHRSRSSAESQSNSSLSPSSNTSSVATPTSVSSSPRSTLLKGSQNRSPSSTLGSRVAPPVLSKSLSSASTPSTPNQGGDARRRLSTQGTGTSTRQQAGSNARNDVQRDPGVTDDVWRQLEADKAAAQVVERETLKMTTRHNAESSRAAVRQQSAEAEVQTLAQKTARDRAEREELERQQEGARIRLKRLVAEKARVDAESAKRIREQEQKKRREQEIQQKLRSLGVCVQGYPWIKQLSGYRCAGGAHFIHDSHLR